MAAKPITPLQKLGYFTKNLLIRGLLGAAMLLPYRWRVPFVGALVSRALAPLVGWRGRIRENLSHVLPELPDTEVKRLSRAVPDNAGRTLIEIYSGEAFKARAARAPISGPGLAALEAARDAGRPVILVTGHMGNYDVVRAALIARGHNMGALYRRMRNPYFNAHYAANMHALSVPVFEQGRRGTMGLLKHIKAGGMGVLLFDVYDSAGVTIDFLGRPAPTLTSAAEIALRTGALLVPFFGIRNADGVTFQAVFEAPIPHGPPEVMMRAVTDRLEARIRQDPGQWFWIHRRWKPKRQGKRQRKRAAASM